MFGLLKGSSVTTPGIKDSSNTAAPQKTASGENTYVFTTSTQGLNNV